MKHPKDVVYKGVYIHFNYLNGRYMILFKGSKQPFAGNLKAMKGIVDDFEEDGRLEEFIKTVLEEK